MKNNTFDIIEVISDGMKYDREELLYEVEEAKKAGIPYYRYFKNEYWRIEAFDKEISNKQNLIKQIEDRLENLKSEINDLQNLKKIRDINYDLDVKGFEINQKRIENVCKETGWTKYRAKKEIQKAITKGVSPYSYVYHSCWNFSESEISELGNLIKLYKKRESDKKEYYINIVREKTGWSEEYANSRMEEAKQKGYSHIKFVKQALWKLPDDEFKKLTPVKTLKTISGNRNQVNLIKEKRREQQNIIMKEMGWTFGRFKLESFKSNIIAGTTLNEYFHYKLYKYPAEEGLKYVTEEIPVKMRLRYCDWGGNYIIFSDKRLFSEKFKKFIRRKCFSNKSTLSFEEFENQIRDMKKIIVKPINELGGHGVKKYVVNQSEKENLTVYDEIMSGGEYIIEESIEYKQHKDIMEFWPETVNTIRVLSMYKDGEFRVLGSVIKLGTQDVIDGLVGGKGIVAGINIETGIICTDGVDIEGNIYEEHPITKKKFKGSHIPSWDNVLNIAEEAAKVVSSMPFVGWDITVRENGEAEIIEGNHNPAGFLVQWPFAISEHEGKRHAFDPYIEFR